MLAKLSRENSTDFTYSREFPPRMLDMKALSIAEPEADRLASVKARIDQLKITTQVWTYHAPLRSLKLEAEDP